MFLGKEIGKDDGLRKVPKSIINIGQVNPTKLSNTIKTVLIQRFLIKKMIIKVN